MRIRAFLLLMAAAILVPVVLFSSLALGMLQHAQQEMAEKSLDEIAHGLGLLVDRELYSADAALRVLARSPSLARGELAAFYAEAHAANRGTDRWILLLDGDGKQVFTTRLPLGEPLFVDGLKERVADVLTSGKTRVSDVIVGRTSKRLVTTVNVPAPPVGAKSYVVAMVFTTSYFSHLIADGGVPGDWVAAVIDSQGRFIARSKLTEELVGKPARPELVAAARSSRSGQIRHVTLDGVDSFDAFTHSAMSGWTVAVAAPVAVITRSATTSTWVAGLGLAMALLAATALAVVFGVSHERAIARAVSAATDLGRGIAPPPTRSRVVEVDQLHAALFAAGEQLTQSRAYRQHAEQERTALLAAAQEARAHAERENAAKDDFLAMLGHELRNPLAPISTAAQLLRLPHLDRQRVRHASDVIARQVEHMNRLLGDLLDMSRVTRGLVVLNIEGIDVKLVLERAWEQARGLVEARGQQLVWDLPADAVFVQGDATRLIQVFANILDNAAKYTPPNGHLGVTLRSDADRNVAVLVFEDDGVGLDAELLPRIFELFSQGARTAARSEGGLGLGLALVRRLLELHGGTVRADSAGIGCGSRFTVTLPMAPVRAGVSSLAISPPAKRNV